MPSRTPSPVSVSESGEATATWTPVPGNPIWSFWTFENVEFQLPVAWHKGDDGSASDSLYVGPDGDGRPQLSISIGKAPAGADSARFARERLGRLKSALRGFSLVESDSSSISGLPAERASYRYEALNPNAPPGNGGLMRGVAWYAVRGEASFAFEFSVDDRRFGALLPVFDDIAARASIRS